MRRDAIGFLWVTPPEHKPVKPDPVWELPTYLPGLAEARAFPVDLFPDAELIAEAGGTLVFDCEVYTNYFLVAFRSEKSRKVVYLESPHLDIPKLNWILANFTLVSFNGNNFDLPILALACAGCTTEQLKQATNLIINCNERASKVLQHFKVKPLSVNHIDIIEVCPLEGSLKLYSARLHCKKMQDLPFHPDTILSDDQITIIRYYCCNDLVNTSLCYNALLPDLDLRVQLSTDYRMDLRSKSDAQIAEAVISHEVTAKNGLRPKRPEVVVGEKHYYKVPSFISYRTELLQYVLSTVSNSAFIVSDDTPRIGKEKAHKKGSIILPKAISELRISIHESTYQMGIGGLHSTEERKSHKSDSEYVLLDRDVASYYPAIIINQNLYPKHLGSNFGIIYRTLRDRRLKAKDAGEERIAGSLKITINGGFGKFGSRWSMLYSPELLIQVTITGQLSLLMLIEDIELAGIRVISANTDGIVIKCPRNREHELSEIIRAWEIRTDFKTEETRYSALYSRDVNNYIAVKEDGKTKGKGIFANPWTSKNFAQQMQKNPHSTVCVESVTNFLAKGVSIEETIWQCRDFTKFVSVQNVKGGAVKDGEYLGKTIRWYYAKGTSGVIVRASNGNKVPCSEGAKPAMQLPDSFPDDVDFEWYVTEARGMLVDLGYR